MSASVKFTRSTKDEQLAALLAAGFSIDDAAAEVDLSARTVYRKLECAEFRERIAAIRTAYVSGADGRIRNAMTKAASVLEGMLDSPMPSIRLKAAVALLKIGYASYAGRGDGR